MAEWVDQNLRNRDARAMFGALQSADPPTKRTILLEEAQKAGLSGCALAESIPAKAETTFETDARALVRDFGSQLKGARR